MSAPVVEPSACTWCAIARRGHGRQFADAVGWHEWAQPSQEQVLARMKARRLAVTVAKQGALPVPVPVGPEPKASAGYPPALPWAALMDDEDFYDFRDDLVAAAAHGDRERAPVEMEKAVSTWRLIAEAQHGHNTAPGPDAVTAVFSPVASLREPEGEFYPFLHRDGRVPHDMPETGGTR
ncbi:hypothetical protein [Streptomyces bottropensis]|uniref:hypothetical protein n=1 Tax=Streptomyces bottropensis TaxID=42235 RepID=UPI00368223DB